MLRKDAHVMAVVTKFETKAKKHGTVQALILKVESIGEAQTFLETYEDQCRNSGPIMQLFTTPVSWKSVQIEAAYLFDVVLNTGNTPIHFQARLAGIKVNRTYKNGFEHFVYQLQMEKELEPAVDKDLAHFVNAKELNMKSGRLETVLWPFELEALEPVAQSVNTETGGEAVEGDFES